MKRIRMLMDAANGWSEPDVLDRDRELRLLRKEVADLRRAMSASPFFERLARRRLFRRIDRRIEQIERRSAEIADGAD